MAGLLCTVTSGEVALATSAAKTLLQVKAPANQRVVVHAIRLHGKQPTGGTDTPVKVRLTRSTANFGTGTTATPGKADPSHTETIQAACAAAFSVEPTTPADTGLWWEVPSQSGLIEHWPPEARLEIPGGQSLQVEATSAGTPTVLATVTFEE